jgi:membrane protein YdbS with pleckstrin-like domain
LPSRARRGTLGAVSNVPDDERAAAPADLGDRLESRVVAYWYAADVSRALIFGALLVTAAEFWRAHEGRYEWAPAVAWALGGAMLLLALVTPPLAYARWRFSVDDRLLSMRYGILFVEERRVPVPRMQHVDLVRGPLERLFGLATLVVFTAGNEGSAFRVPGLLRARAEALRDRILRARGRDVV